MKKTHRSTLRISAGGRVVIPVAVREQLGMKVGSQIVLIVEGNHLRLSSAKVARQQAQDLVSRYIPASVSLSSELMADRKMIRKDRSANLDCS
jgi:AbrB family looped-hinge helix DNA binding protein